MYVLPLLHSAIVILSNLVQMEAKLAALRNALLILTFCYCAVSAVSHICALPAVYTYVYIRDPELEYTYMVCM